MIISVFTPHGGCPERCRFCDQRVSGGEAISAKAVREQIEIHLRSNFSGPTQVAFYGGTFTAMPRERQLAYLLEVRPYLESGAVSSVRISTRPDALEAAWLERLKNEFHLATVELGAQSFNTNSLRALGRSHSVAQIGEGVKLLHDLGLESGLHFMIGVPEETPSNDEDLVQNVLRLRPGMVRLHPLLVITATPLEEEWRRGLFHPIELEAAVERCAWLTPRIEAAGIPVIRLGLQANELLGAYVLAGAYHPAFGDLVRGRVWRNRLEIEFENAHVPPNAKVELQVNERDLGTVRGPGSANVEWLRKRFALRYIRVRPGRVIKGTHEVRIYDPPRAPERGKVQHPQPSGGGRARHRHAKAADDVAELARLRGSTRP